MGNASCKYAGQDYSDGSEVCQEGRLMVCRDGNWADTGSDCDRASKETLKYFEPKFDGAQVYWVAKSSATRFSCQWTGYDFGTNEYTLTNPTDNCIRCRFRWYDGVMDSRAVAAHSDVRVYKRSVNAQIVDEQHC